MATRSTYYRYHFRLGNKIVHTGITNDIDLRELEHRRKDGWERGHIVQVGYRTTPEAALQWEDEQRKSGKPTGSRKVPPEMLPFESTTPNDETIDAARQVRTGQGLSAYSSVEEMRADLLKDE